jgi:hypothetical protein
MTPASSVVPDTAKAMVTTPVVATPPPPVTIATAAPKINPAHGQPGHRCDIAVGAPMPAPGTTPAAPPSGQQPGPTVQTIVPPPPPPVINTSPVTGTGKAVNPPHGQPGHRCDIAVGAPLN